jgi:hypothetical protein
VDTTRAVAAWEAEVAGNLAQRGSGAGSGAGAEAEAGTGAG